MEGRIYIHRDKINGKCYVGQTIRDPKKRWGDNGIRYKNCSKFNSSIKKYGWNNFEHIILPEVYSNYDELNKAEMDMINRLDSFNNGYNSTSGGNKNKIVSDETKNKLSKANTGKKRTLEDIEKMRIRSAGRSLSLESRKKVSEARIGKKKSEETKKKMSEWQIGRVMDEKARNKMSESAKKRDHSKRNKPTIIYDIFTETDYIHKSVLECCTFLNISKTTYYRNRKENRLISNRYYIESI